MRLFSSMWVRMFMLLYGSRVLKVWLAIMDGYREEAGWMKFSVIIFCSSTPDTGVCRSEPKTPERCQGGCCCWWLLLALEK